MRKDLKDDLAELLNQHSMEQASETPDYVLAEYMLGCLYTYEKAIVGKELFWDKQEKECSWV